MREERLYYVYILASERNGTLYVGVTNDVLRRLREHRDGECSFTKKYGIRTLVYFDVTNDPMSAIASEKRIKKWERKWKLRLIEERNPHWKDLSKELTGPPPSRG